MANNLEVILLVASSIDGFIAPLDQETLPSTVWTSSEDKAFFTTKSKAIGTMIMGSKTFATIGRALPGRRSIVMTQQPEKYVVYQDDKNLVFTDQTPVELLASLEKQGVKQVAICGGATIYTMFLKQQLVDQLFITLEPYVFGQGVKLFNAPLAIGFKLRSQQQLNEQGTLLLEYSR